MNLTLQEVKDIFQRYCDEFDKLLIPNVAQDDAVIRNLLSYYNKLYDEDLLKEAIRYFVKEYDEGAVTITEFAIRSSYYRDKAERERGDREELSDLMQQTKRMMGK